MEGEWDWWYCSLSGRLGLCDEGCARSLTTWMLQVVFKMQLFSPKLFQPCQHHWHIVLASTTNMLSWTPNWLYEMGVWGQPLLLWNASIFLSGYSPTGHPSTLTHFLPVVLLRLMRDWLISSIPGCQWASALNDVPSPSPSCELHAPLHTPLKPSAAPSSFLCALPPFIGSMHWVHELHQTSPTNQDVMLHIDKRYHEWVLFELDRKPFVLRIFTRLFCQISQKMKNLNGVWTPQQTRAWECYLQSWYCVPIQEN